MSCYLCNVRYNREQTRAGRCQTLSEIFATFNNLNQRLKAGRCTWVSIAIGRLSWYHLVSFVKTHQARCSVFS